MVPALRASTISPPFDMLIAWMGDSFKVQ